MKDNSFMFEGDVMRMNKEGKVVNAKGEEMVPLVETATLTIVADDSQLEEPSDDEG